MSRVALGVSGGFDSAVSAWMLKRDGHDVVAITLLFSDAPADERKYDMASSVCAKLGIEQHVIDVKARYAHEVMGCYASQCAQGLLPDPFVEQTRLVLRELFAARDEFGCDRCATGHYASIAHETDLAGALPYQLCMATDAYHDQSYYLYGLGQRDLETLLFPLHGTSKPVARMQAMRAGLMLAQFEETECVGFLKDIERERWLSEHAGLDTVHGQVVHVTTRAQLAEHEGLHLHPLGSRFANAVSEDGEALHVIAHDFSSNTLLVGPKGLSGSEQCFAHDVNWVSIDAPEAKRSCKARLAQGRKPVPVQLVPTKRGLAVTFNERVYGLMPGQPIVFYSDTLVLGGGIVAG